MKEIKLNKEISIDTQKLLQSRMVILANSGGGKSYAIRKFAEGAVGEVQTIIIDPEGEFASLREKYDFILAGKGADVPVEVRSATLLATKLLELGKSAVIDLYELHPQERQRYVKLFCEALVNAPKELYHPVFIVLDEAHEYAPEGKPSEATYAVEALASRGRKRGFCLIPASQRISKLSKNVSAECNNKLIGRASQDIDMKRAGDELGFNKDRLVELRQLKPGEFFAFGPAISDEIIKVKIGEVHTTHAKVGYKGAQKTPPASAVIKKVLAELHDLPEEAEREAKTIAELKTEIVSLNRKMKTIAQGNISTMDIDAAVTKARNIAIRARDAQWDDAFKGAQKYCGELEKMIVDAIGVLQKSHKFASPSRPNPFLYGSIAYIPEDGIVKGNPVLSKESLKEVDQLMKDQSSVTHVRSIDYVDTNGKIIKPLSKGAQSILAYLRSVYPRQKTKAQIWIATGYAPGGGFNNLVYELTGSGLIQKVGETFLAGYGEGDFDTSFIKWQSKLSKGAWAIFQFLMETPEEAQSKSIIAEQTHYAEGGGFNNLIYELSGKEFIKKVPEGYLINPEILDL